MKKPIKKGNNSFENKKNDSKKSFSNKRNFSSKPKNKPTSSNSDGIRLNKFIANAGICSRREADKLIETGLVQVNNEIMVKMGYKVQPTDIVKFDDKTIRPEKPIYVLLNKPKGYLASGTGEKGQKQVGDLVANASPYQLFPIGNLERTSTGVILLSNDIELNNKLSKTENKVKKLYHLTLDKPMSFDDLKKLEKDGVRLEEGLAKVTSISYIEGAPKTEIGIELELGWNKLVHRICKKMGYEILFLDRVVFAGLTKKNIKRGQWRVLMPSEVNFLKML